MWYTGLYFFKSLTSFASQIKKQLLASVFPAVLFLIENFVDVCDIAESLLAEENLLL